MSRRFRFDYSRPDLAAIGWVISTARMTREEINRAIRDEGFPAPTTNVAGGKELWVKREVEAWVDARGLRKTLHYKTN